MTYSLVKMSTSQNALKSALNAALNVLEQKIENAEDKHYAGQLSFDELDMARQDFEVQRRVLIVAYERSVEALKR
jgi:hypothetical protein